MNDKDLLKGLTSLQTLNTARQKCKSVLKKKEKFKILIVVNVDSGEQSVLHS